LEGLTASWQKLVQSVDQTLQNGAANNGASDAPKTDAEF
jgi:hypothetical protein